MVDGHRLLVMLGNVINGCAIVNNIALRGIDFLSLRRKLIHRFYGYWQRLGGILAVFRLPRPSHEHQPSQRSVQRQWGHAELEHPVLDRLSEFRRRLGRKLEKTNLIEGGIGKVEPAGAADLVFAVNMIHVFVWMLSDPLSCQVQ